MTLKIDEAVHVNANTDGDGSDDGNREHANDENLLTMMVMIRSIIQNNTISNNDVIKKINQNNTISNNDVMENINQNTNDDDGDHINCMYSCIY